MKLIVHCKPKYGYFVGWRKRNLGFDAVWQPNVRKAIKAFGNYLLAHPSTDVEKEYKILTTRASFKGQLTIVDAS